MAVRKDIDTAVKLKEFSRSVEKLLPPGDKDYLFYALKEYNTYKSIPKLMLALNSCLDTPEKLDLLPYIRDLIPRHDRSRFDSLAPYNRMAHPIKMTSDVKRRGGSLKRSDRSPTITLNLHRPKGAPLGFSIRGGREHDLGVYVSYVDSLSLAEKVGLQVGDQIVNVNGIDFERVSHSSAVLVLKSHDDFQIEIRRVGRVPGQKLTRDSFVWVDPSGKPVEETDGPVTKPTSTEGINHKPTSNGLPGASNNHKVVLHASKKSELGFSIRGGNEYGLGIYISSVDSKSLAEEGGLQVGDQIMDVNGHSFLSILHQEAVHILRSYQTLILTIQSLGRYPKLVSESEKPQNEVGGVESPSFRERTSSFFKSLTAPLSSPSQKRKSFNAEEESNSPASSNTSANLAPPKTTSVKRSNSARSSEKPASASAKQRPDSAKKFSSLSRGRSISLESGAFTTSQFKRPALAVSPLATHEARASSTHSPNTTAKFNGTASGSGTPKFFEKGIGSQLMLASATSQAEQILLDHARRLLSEEESEMLKQSIEEYKENEDVSKLANFLISTLDTPEKIQLMTDIRSILYPEDITNFDELVSLHELKGLSLKHKQAQDDRAVQHNAVLAEIQNHNGHKSLVSHNGERKTQPAPDLGAFGSKAAQSVLQKATTPDSEQDLAGLQSKESFLAWNESYLPSTDDEQSSSSTNHMTKTTKSPVVIEIPKTLSYLGLSVNGGTDTPDLKIRVRDIKEGGIIHNDGFIKPGYEILEVDGVQLRGKTHKEVVQIIAEAFTSTNPTLKFIVIPS